MSAPRSPILGFNHNMKHRGLVFHVQTEDSGVKNPHIFTHCFHGGVILNSRKMDYDASSDEETVKALMQSLHKAMLKQLKKGELDDKIDSYLSGHPDLLPSAQKAKAETNKPLTEVQTPPAESLAPVVTFDKPLVPPKDVKPAGKPKGKRAQRPSGIYSKVRQRAKTETPPVVPNIKPAENVTRKKRSTAKRGAAESDHTERKGNVVISRPSVVVGGNRKKRGTASGKAANLAKASARKTQIFGSDLSSDKNLDDVIKAYLDDQKGEK